MTARYLACLASAALLMASAPVATAAGSFFASLDGAWTGSGKVKMDSGKSERIKCKGYYNAKSGGSELGVAIDCANAAVRINMRAKLVDAGGRVTGTWEEREFNQSGAVSGKVTADKLTLSFAGGISGSMSISTSSSGQTVTISTGGPGFVGAELQFSKSGGA